jgi:uncharacterized membrane protein HdeD (DUF308 family)
MRGVRIATYVGRGCLGIIVGALALVLGRSSTTGLYALVAAWAIGTGALEMAFASRSWLVLPRALGFMLVGAVSLGFGLSLLPFPLETATSLRVFLVAFALLNGVAALFVGEELHPPPRHVLPSRAS